MPSLDSIQRAPKQTAQPRTPTVRTRQRSITPHPASAHLVTKRRRAVRLAVGVVMVVLVAGWLALFGRSWLRTSSTASVNPFRTIVERIGALFGGTNESATELNTADEEHLQELRASVFPEFERVLPKE